MGNYDVNDEALELEHRGSLLERLCPKDWFFQSDFSFVIDEKVFTNLSHGRQTRDHDTE